MTRLELGPAGPAGPGEAVRRWRSFVVDAADTAHLRPLPSADRWLYAWSTGYAAVGAASLLASLYAVALGTASLLVVLGAAAGVLGTHARR